MIAFRSLEWEAEKTPKGRWYFRPRPYVLLGVTALTIILSALFEFAQDFEVMQVLVGADLLRLFSRMLAVVSVLPLAAALAQERRRLSLYPAGNTLITRTGERKRGYEVRLQDTVLGGKTLVSVWATTDCGETYLLVPGQPEEKRQDLELLRNQWQPVGREAPPEPPAQKSFPLEAYLLLTLGALWLVCGKWWAPQLLWELDETHGVLVWPFGFFLLTLGVLELFGIKILESARRRDCGTLLGVAILAVYFFLSWRLI